MKTILIFVSFLMLGFAFGQFETNKPEPCYAKAEERAKSRFVEWECGQLVGVVDCNSKLDYDENLDIMFSRGSGSPYTGECETCHNNGLREHRIRFVNGREDGVDTTYYETGCMQVIRSHSVGKENGKWTYFYDRTAQTAWIMNYLNGEKHGEHIYFGPKGDTTLWEFYSNGRLHGKKTTYYKGSKIKEEVSYKNGVLDGLLISYFEDGQVSKRLNFKAGIKDGKQEYYYNNGAILKVENFNKNLKDGEFTTFFINGDIQVREVYKRGAKEGRFEEYYPNGKLKSEFIYEKNQLVLFRKYDEFGRLTEGTPKESEGDEDDALPGKKKKKKKKK